MRFMFIRRADPTTEAGTPPAPGVFDAMEKYHQEMAAAGLTVSHLQVNWGEIWAEVAAAG